jgi:hypothetical protein
VDANPDVLREEVHRFAVAHARAKAMTAAAEAVFECEDEHAGELFADSIQPFLRAMGLEYLDQAAEYLQHARRSNEIRGLELALDDD